MKKIISVVFLVFIFLMSILLFVNSGKEYSQNEKRYLARMPEFSVASLLDGSYLSSFEEFVSDHIFFRDFFKGLNSYTNLALGKNTASDIYFCKDGYLINAPKNVSLESFEKNIKKFDEFSKNADIPSTLIMIPQTGYIMDDVLPKNAKEYPDDELFEFCKKQDLDLLDVRPVLKNAQKQVFYKTDHHLTSYGNYLIYKAFCEEKGLNVCNDYKVENYDGFYGTTYSGSGYFLNKPDTIELWDNGKKVSLEIYEDEKVYDTLFFKEHLSESDKYPVFLGGNHSFLKIKNPSLNDKKILVVKDSFAQCFAPFLTANYSEIYMVDLRYYRKSVSDIVKENNVDEILFMYGVDTLLTDTNSFWLK